MPTTTKISDVLTLAIERLYPGGVSDRPGHYYSCNAILAVCQEQGDNGFTLYFKVLRYLKEFGIDAHRSCFEEFESEAELAPSVEAQQARALWLTWAAMIAREEGL